MTEQGEVGNTRGEDSVEAPTRDPVTARLLESIASPDDEEPNFDEAISPIGEVFDLSTIRNWRRLYRRIKDSRPGESNLNAWQRCLAIMRHHGAKTVIFESHYVCLEYRSEFITFYAHIDKDLPTVVRRLHFFKAKIDADALGRLNNEQRASYLGYIVVRPGDLPIVGRAHMSPPDFVEISTSVKDTVHLFGQELEVVGVPFMEQESRMAECGNVALWMVHHTAFLRKLFERKFIADFIDMPENRWPMRVSSPRGMNPMEAAKVLDDVGFHSEWKNADEHWLPPPVEWADILESASRSDEDNIAAEHVRVDEFSDVSAIVDGIILDVSDDIEIGEAEQTALEEYNRAVVQQLRPHLQSGLPVYVGTHDHALVACGLDHEGRVVVHDDQFGPYLTADRLVSLSRSELNVETPRVTEVAKVLGSDPVDFENWWAHSRQPHGWVSSSRLVDRASLDFIFAQPPRVFLRLGEARKSGLERLQTAIHVLLDDNREPASLFGDLVPAGLPYPEVATEWTDSTVLVKGITYKALARKRFRSEDEDDDEDLDESQSDPLGEAMSWVQLSEWVAVVELVSVVPQGEAAGKRVGIGEIVFDSSSDDLHPRILVLRVGNRAVFRQPKERLHEAQTGVGTLIRPFADVLALSGNVLRP